MFSIFDLSLTDYYIIGAALFCAVLLLLLFLPAVIRVTRRVSRDASEPMPDVEYPPVSVIVYTNSDGDNLAALLPEILEQDYPSPFEVIVVNDGDASEIECSIGALELRYSNLYMTYAPSRSRNLSRKKLSLTLGIKAARYDTVVITSGNCRPCSSLWLRGLCRNFTDGKDIVIGYAIPAQYPESTRPRISRTASFDETYSAVRYLSWGIAHRPFRGDGSNIAYRKCVFTDAKGFSSHLNLNFGDDDIFINQVATRENTAIELSPDSMVYSFEHDPSHAHRFNKMRYDFTSRRIHTGAFRYFAACSWLWWLWLLTSAGATAYGLLVGTMSLIPALAVTAIALGLCIPVMVAWRSCARSLAARPLCLTVIWFILLHPFYNIYYRIRGHYSKSRNFTWEF